MSGDLAATAVVAGRPAAHTPAAGTLAVGTAIPLTWGQRGLWALQRLAPSSPVLHIAIAARVIDGELDTAVFVDALRATMARHPAWRTTFHETAEGVEARVGMTSSVAVIEEDLPADSGETALTARLESIAAQPFDLTSGPLVRVAVLRQGAHAHLLFIVHHLIADLWSLAIVIRQVGTAYASMQEAGVDRTDRDAVAAAGVTAGAGAWGAHVARQEARLDSDEGARLERFWRQRLADPPAPLELPADRLAQAWPSFRGGTVLATLDAGLADRLRQWSREQGTTPFPVLLAVFNLLLTRYTGQRDLIVGSPVAGRSSRDVSKLVGYLVEMIAVRTSVDEDQTFAALVADIGASVKDALAHQAYPLPRLAQKLAARGVFAHLHDGRSPFFRVAFAYQKAPRRGPAAAFGALSIGMGGVRFPVGPLSMVSMPLATDTAQLDLTVLAAEVDGRLGLTFQYDADRFDHDTVSQWQRHFVALLRTALDAPDVAVVGWSMLDADDRERLFERARGTTRGTTRGIDLATESIDRLVARQVCAIPEALAIAALDGCLTYGQLGERANRVTASLLGFGVGPEQVVGVFVERSTWLPVALFGTLQSGAAYLQIDPALPPERVSFLARDAGLAAIVTVDGLRSRLPALDVPVVAIDQAEDAAVDQSNESASARARPGYAQGIALDRLAYLIYTSGSTGRPKGVAVSHRSLRNLIGWYHQAYDLGPGQRVSQLSGLSFDATVFEIWPALTVGASLHMADEATRLDPARLASWLHDEGVTIAFLPTPLAEAYLRLPDAGAPPMRYLLAAGDRLRTFRPPGFEARLHNLYGPTESTVATTEAAVPLASSPTAGTLPSIGRPISNVRVYVLDRRQRLSPPGAVGELWIGGAGVARGYRGQPSLTADRFRPDPWGQPGDRLYRSGDLVRFRKDGELDFCGRTDQQLKIRGFRIEPGEVEAALRAVDDVAEAVVEARGEGETRRLVAWVLAAATGRGAGTAVDPSTLSASLAETLRQQLPSYMVPSAWVLLDALPLTANGKIDRRALPEPQAAGSAGEAPRSATEKAVAAMWSELLAIDLPGREDDFFALGGHSLLATQMSARLRARFGVAMPMRTLFEHSQLADLAVQIDHAEIDDDRDGIAIVARDTATEVPLSFAQERLWFLDQLHPGLVAYNIPAAVDLLGRVRVDVLAATLSALVARHEVLRTRLVASAADKPVQVIDAPAPVPLPVVDLGRLAPDMHRAAVESRAAAEAAAPFDLAAGPLLRATLLEATLLRAAPAGAADADGVDTHTLLLTLHHSVADGLSMAVMQREIAALYDVLATDRPAELPPLPVQYGDYALWQRARLARGALDGELAYWRARLAGMPEVMALPTDRPRPPVIDHRGARIELLVDPARVEALDVLARKHDATLFMVLLAAFDALLARLTGEADVVVGAPVAGRPRTELEPLVGLFVNLVPLRTNLAGDPRFDALLGRVRETVLDAFEHQEIPFERVVEAVQPVRNQGHTPIFQVLFAMVDAPRQALRVSDLDLHWWAPERATAQFDLGLSLHRIDGAIAGELEYRTALFDPDTARRIVDRYLAVLDAVLADAACPLSCLPLVTVPEVACLRSWNATAESAYEPALEQSLHALVEAQAARTPDAVAVTYGEQRLTFAELMDQSARLACHLRSLGIGNEVLVGICAERSLELIVGLVGILRSGAAYVPLDPSYPKERLACMVEDACSPVVLVQERLRDRLPVTDATLVMLGSEAAWRAGSTQLESRATSSDALAYTIFTSGSTGRPKGAMNPHRAVVNRLLWMQDAYRLGPDDRVLQKTPFSFDVSVWELFWPLITGARLIMAPPEVHKDSDRLSRLIEAQSVTVLHFVPSMLQAFLCEPGLEGRCRTVRQVISSGEALPFDLQERFFARLPQVRLDNLYGPTEAAVDVTVWPCVAGGAERMVPIGRPIANTRIHVLDQHLRETPIGVHGELFIGGVQVGRGYYRRPRLTAECFVPDPLAGPTNPGARLYATGDRARWRNDGSIEYLGRIDFQVKLRGLRIELGEIEAALVEHRQVREAVVGMRATPVGDHLVAYLTAEGQEPAVDALRAHLGTRLPDYMVPRIVIVLDALPLSPNGKVDRRALGRLALPAMGAEPDARPPRTTVEKQVAALWAEVLGLGDDALSNVDDDFFALGGHSLLATQLAGRLRRTFGVALPLRSLFEHTTVASLSAAIEGAKAGPDGSPASIGERHAPPLVATDRDTSGSSSPRSGPLSFAQERLWFVDQILGASAAYNMHGALQLDGPLEMAALHQSLESIVARHEALRTIFPSADGRPRAEVVEQSSVLLEQVDLAELPTDAREQAAQRRRRGEAAWCFDLAHGPLLRVAVLRLTATRHVVLLTMHHIVADGWSMGVLQRELMALYAGFVADRPVTLPALPVQYGDYAAWQREWLRDEVLAAPLAYWRAQLGAEHPMVRLPGLRSRPAEVSLSGATATWRLSPTQTEALHAFAQREGATLFMVVLAAFQAVLHRTSGQTEIRVGAPVANRRPEAVEGLIGCFVNMLVLRGDLSGDPTFRVFLDQVRATVVGAQEHQDMPYEKLVEALRPVRGAGQSALFNVVLAFQNAPAEDLALPGLTVKRLPLLSEQAKFDLSLNAEVRDGALSVDLEYRTAVLDRATVERLTGHLEELIAGVIDDADRRVSALPLLSPGERTALLEAWNDTAVAREAGEDRSVLHRFTAHARARPEALAVTDPEGAVSYGDLDRWSTRVACSLRTAGVAPGSVVAVCAGRSRALVAALLAIWKTGAAYLPLDPAYPARRMRLMLDDARAAAMVARSSDLGDLGAGDCGLPVITIDQPPADLGSVATLDEPDVTPTHDPDALALDALAYVIYTSGSTGRPKGVEVAHRGLENLVAWHTRRYAVTADDRATLIASPAFDASVWELWPYLAQGASLAIPEEDVRIAPPLLLDWMAAEGVTTSFLPVPLAEAFLDLPMPAGLRLRSVLTGGDQLRRRPPARLPWSLVNHYGPTEDSVVSTAGVVTSASEVSTAAEAGLPSIGRPIDNHRVYVLDAAFRLVPVGVAGELWVGGAGVARGYQGRPELTAAAFVPDPWGPAGARLYRTGDQVRWRPDGTLDFLGRRDHQVQIRGVRVELGEVESALGSHPGIHEAVALLRETEAGQALLTAYVVPRTEGTERVPDADDLRAYLLERIPEAMVPAATVFLDALPRTENGKVDRDRLPAPVALLSGEADDTPMTPQETVLATIFAEVLGIAAVGRHDDFFALGGHSLLATQAVARIRDALEIDLELRTLFEQPTVAALAGRLASADAESSRQRSIPVTPVARDRPLALSFAQERLWILERLEPGGTAYNMPATLRLSGRLVVPALGASLDALVARHESLRTVFVADAGVPHQVVLPAAPVVMAETDLRALSPAARDAEAARLRDAHARITFDLAQGPLLASHLLRLADDEHDLLLNVHHIVFDGWSFGIFSHELGVLYRAFVEGAPPPLAVPTLQYGDYAAWQRVTLDADERARQLAYWRERLAGVPLGTDLPTDRPRPAVRTFRGGHRRGHLSPVSRLRLETLGHERGATLFMVLLAGWKAVLHRLAGQDDVLIGSPVAGRTRQELEGLIGVFLNNLVLRTDVGGNPPFIDLIDRVRETTLGAYAHQDVPFEMLIEALAPERDASRTPFFQVFFNMLDLPQAPLELVGLRLEPVTAPEAGAKFDLTIYASRGVDGLCFDLVYNADLFDDVRMAALLDAYAGFLDAVAAAPATPIGAVSLVGALDRRYLPDPRAMLDDTWHGSVHTWFARRAVEAPERLALVDQDGAWNYGELAVCVRSLARRLTKAGVTREAPVAIYAHRSASLVWAMMAVGEAGGAFLILDPAYPPSRLIAIVKRALPVAWLQLAQAGPLPPALAAYLDTRASCAQILLPRFADAGRLADGDDESPAAASLVSPVAVSPDDRALLAFTSGSTGEPKGIEGRHGPLSHFLPWQQANFGLCASDRYSLLSGLAHDPLQRDVFTALATGAALYIPDPDRMFEPGYLAAWMRETRISVAHMTPAIGQILAESPPGGAPTLVPSLRLTMLVGDALTQRDVARLRELAPSVRVINLYGATETQRAVSWHDGTAEADSDSRQVLALGRGMDDVQLLVINPARQLAGIGELGEIWVRSPHLARGYLEDSQRTNERFEANPFPAVAGDRAYRTGDLGRYRPDGEVSFAGRADQQVKIRGFRVELGEIEAQLLGHPDVVSAAVVQRGPERKLAAFIAGADGVHPDRVSVREHLVERLPAYMIPAAIVVLDALPLNPNGKLDRRALPDPESFSDLGAATAYVAPRSDAERVLAAVWAMVLGCQRVGIRDNFFALGGDSLLAIRMVSQAHRRQLDVDAKLIFQYQTIEELASHTRAAVPLALAPADGAVPLTQVQRRFFEEVLAGAADQIHHFNIDRLVAVPPSVDLARLAQAVRLVLRSHDAFSLRFAAPDGSGWTGEDKADRLRQMRVDADDARLDVGFVDLSALGEAARSSVLEAVADRLQHSLDLFAGPLVRACIFSFGEGEYARLLLIAHHLLADGYSLVVAQEDMAVAYEQLGRGEAVRLPPATTPFTAWAQRLDAFVGTPAMAAERPYWLEQPWLTAQRPPVDDAEAPMPIHSMRGHVASLGADATEVLLHRAPVLADGAGLNEVVLTALARSAARWEGSSPIGSGARPLHVDVIGHGRDAFMEGVDLSRTVGWLAVIFPLLISAADDDPMAALAAVRAHVLAVPHSGIGYGLLRFAADDPAGRAAIEAAVPRAGMVLNFFSSLGLHDREAATESMVPAPERAGSRLNLSLPLLYPLMLTSNVSDGQLHLRWNYSANRYRPETVEGMAADVHAEVEALADRCRTCKGP